MRNRECHSDSIHMERKLKYLITILFLFLSIGKQKRGAEILFAASDIRLEENRSNDIRSLFSCTRKITVTDGLSQNMVYCICQDYRGFLWFGTRDGLNRFDGTDVVVYRTDDSDPNSPGSNKYFSILEDDEKKLWLGTSDGVFLYNPVLDRFSPFTATAVSGETVGTAKVRHICRDNQKNIYLACQDGRIFRYAGKGKMECFNLNEIPALSKDDPVNLRRIDVDERGIIWIATYRLGVIELDPRTKEVKQYFISENPQKNDVNTVLSLNDSCLLIGSSSYGVLSLHKHTGAISPFLTKGKQGNALFVRQLIECADGYIWVGTESGVYACNPETMETSWLYNKYGDSYSLSDNAVHALFEDREGGIWVGTYFGGVNYVKKKSHLEKYYFVAGENTIGGKRISEFCQDDRGFIWIATEDAGLFRFNPILKSFEAIPMPAKNLHALCYDSGKLWVGSFSQGLFLLDTETGQVRYYGSKSGLSSSNSVYSIYLDSERILWAGTMAGLYQYVPQEDRFISRGPDMQSVYISDIIEDHRRVLWFATRGDGLYSFDRVSGKWRKHQEFSKANSTIKDVICLHEDRNGHLWAGTEGAGLILYDSDQDRFISILDKSERLSDETIYSIESDADGNLWGGTNRGLYNINCQDYSVVYYQHDYELLSDQFNYKSGMVDRQGRMYFGTINGFISFLPEEISFSDGGHHLILSSMEVNNQEVKAGDPRFPFLQKSISETKELVIPPTIKTFSLKISEIDYAPAKEVKYYYLIEGWNDEWIQTDLPGKVTFTNVPYGKYVFRVREKGNMAEDLLSLKIEIEPPFYLTRFAFGLYLLLGTLLIVGVMLFVYRRYKRNEAEIRRKQDEEKEKEIYQAKIDFFSNITHEIRTPLSLIKMPIEKMIKASGRDSKENENLLIVKKNTDRLLNLVNQLLDFRKVNGKKLDVQFVHADIAAVVRRTLRLFAPSLQIKGIEMKADVPDRLMADIDVEMCVKMVSNLLNNALKHADKRIDVQLEERENQVVFSVANDGDVIPRNKRDKIFAPYFKLDENADGFGIGLPFTRSLVEIHGGSLGLTERSDRLTQFFISMPLSHDNAICFDRSPKEVRPGRAADESKSYDNSSAKIILMVDDDTAFVDFMVRQFKGKYKIISASGGEAALERIHGQYVDMILSDLVMPNMNGIELCRAVKEDKRYQNTPFLILTGETSIKFKSEAMSAGADVYMEKPVSLDYLEATIDNLFRKTVLSDTSRFSADAQPNELVYTKADETFFDNLTSLIEIHLEEPDLDVSRLAELMNMSRATLYRKVNESLKVTPNEYIRIIRLKKGAELLRQKEYRINEIAFLVGFSSPSYFSKCFYRQYGVLPKDFS